MKNRYNLILGLLAATALLCGAFFTTGCSTTSDNKYAPILDITFQAITMSAVAEHIDGDHKLAQVIINGAEQLGQAIRDSEIVTPLAVDAVVVAYISQTGLSPTAQRQLRILYNVLSDYFLGRIAKGQLDSNRAVELGTLVSWVKQAAEDVVRYDEPQTYGVPPLYDD